MSLFPSAGRFGFFSIVLLLGAWLVSFPSAMASGVVNADGSLTTYMIGNSLIRGLSVDEPSFAPQSHRLGPLFESGVVSSYEYGAQLGAGFRLYQHLDKQAGAGSGTFNFNNPASNPPRGFGDYDNALQKHAFDAVILQPFQTHADFAPDSDAEPDRRFVMGDRQAINAFIDYARGLPPQLADGGRYVPPSDTAAGNRGATRYDLDNPNTNASTDAFYIYETWPFASTISRSGSFAAFWDAAYNPNRSPNLAVPNRAFYDQLVTSVNGDNPNLAMPVRVIPVGEVMYALDQKIRDDELPGIDAFFGRPSVINYFENARDADGSGFVERDEFPFRGYDSSRGVLNFYADNIHLNDQPHNGDDSGTIGAYVAALTWYSVLTGDSPVGLPVGNYEQLDPVLDAALVRALQATVWEVVLSDADTGVVPEPTGATMFALVVGSIMPRRLRASRQAASAITPAKANSDNAPIGD